MNENDYIVVRRPSAVFFRLGALAAAASVFAIIVAQLVLKPDDPDPGITGLITACADNIFQAQSLAILVQVILMFVALLIIAAKVLPPSPGATILAIAFVASARVASTRHRLFYVFENLCRKLFGRKHKPGIY